MTKIDVPGFDPDKPVYWGSVLDTKMSLDELRVALRYLKWKQSADHALDTHAHDILMNDVYGTGLRRAMGNPITGTWTKRDDKSGKFMDVKADPKPFKGVRK